MELSVKRNAILSELSLCQGVTDRKTTIPILSNILLSASGDRVDITATDLDVSICCGCPGEVRVAGTTTLSARRIFDIVRLLPEDEGRDLSLLGDDWAPIRAGDY